MSKRPDRLKQSFLAFVGVIAITACGGGEKAETTPDTTANVVSEDEVVDSGPERFGDTVYASARNVWYNVERLDTTTSGRLESLRDLYASQKSVLTFRRDGLRQGVYGDRLADMPSGFEIEWTANTEADRTDTVFGPWGGGSGWTGQPLYVAWPDSVKDVLVRNKAVNSNFRGSEIVLGSLCGSVYFFDPETGHETRQPIAVGNTIKGTVSVDPTFNGLLYVGHGTPARRPFGAVTVDLFTNEVVDIFKEDPRALRRWGAYDSSAIRVGQFVFRPAENGSVYKFSVEGAGRNAKLRLHSVLRYKVNGAAPGIESSMAVYANYGFVADNHGNVLAINLDNMEPVWHYTLGDDTDATPVIVVEDDKPYVYVGCEIDRQARGYAIFAKLDAATGQEVWKIEPEGNRREDGKKHFDGGFYATPLVGQGNCEGLLFTNMVLNTKGANGVFMAIDTETGRVVYRLPLKYYSWSSPVGFLTEKGEQVVVTADSAGNLYIIDGKEGKIIATQRVGNNFESSPLAIGTSVVIGSRGNGIYKVKLK